MMYLLGEKYIEKCDMFNSILKETIEKIYIFWENAITRRYHIDLAYSQRILFC